MIVVLLAALAQVPAPPPPDTALALEGILVHVPASPAQPDFWALQLLQPLEVGNLRTNVVSLAGNARRWARLEDRYVRARGRLGVRPEAARFAAQLTVERLDDAKPDGITERRVRLSHSQHAVVTLAVVPRRVVLAAGDSQPARRARPAVLYSVANHGSTDLSFLFPNTRAVCVSVIPHRGERHAWRSTTEVSPGERSDVVIRTGVVFRQILPLPPEAVPLPGRYTVTASLCGVVEYEIETQLEAYAP